MNKINEVFTMPMSVDEFIEIANNEEIGTREIRCIVHSLNHVDALVDQLAWMIEIANNCDTGLYDYESAKATLVAYRGEA